MFCYTQETFSGVLKEHEVQIAPRSNITLLCHRASAMASNLPECPVCLETMSAPIFQCQSGHSLCNTCTTSLMPPVCPICRLPMTQMRNWQLEEIVLKVGIIAFSNQSHNVRIQRMQNERCIHFLFC